MSVGRWALFARRINASTAFQPQLPFSAAFANFKQASITAPLPYCKPYCFLMSCFPYAYQPLSVLLFPSYPVLHSLFRSIQGDRACLLHICGNYLQSTTAVISTEGSRTNMCCLSLFNILSHQYTWPILLISVSRSSPSPLHRYTWSITLVFSVRGAARRSFPLQYLNDESIYQVSSLRSC
jgi:hypothetical protein